MSLRLLPNGYISALIGFGALVTGCAYSPTEPDASAQVSRVARPLHVAYAPVGRLSNGEWLLAVGYHDQYWHIQPWDEILLTTSAIPSVRPAVGGSPHFQTDVTPLVIEGVRVRPHLSYALLDDEITVGYHIPADDRMLVCARLRPANSQAVANAEQELREIGATRIDNAPRNHTEIIVPSYAVDDIAGLVLAFDGTWPLHSRTTSVDGSIDYNTGGGVRTTILLK